MAVTTLTGLVATDDVLSNELVVDMSDEIAMLHPDEDQFFTLLNKLPKRNAEREQVNWLEDQLFPRYTTTAASGTSAATGMAVAVGTGAYFRAGDVCVNQATGERFTVTTVTTDTLTIGNRGLGGSSAAAIGSGDGILIVSNAAAQGATLGTAKMTKKVLGYNYTQIIRHPFRFTKTNLWVRRYGPTEPGREAAKKLTEHRRSIEYVCFFGPRDFITSGSEPIGFCGGVDEFITTNSHTSIGNLTNTGIDGYLRQDLQNARNPALFAAPLPASVISNMLRTVWHPNTTGDRVYGAKVDYWLDSAYGTRTPIFVKKDWNDFPTASGQYGGRVYVISLSDVQLRPAPAVGGEPRFAALLKDRQARDADEQAMEYLSELSLEVRSEAHHSRWSGITG